MIHFHVKPQSPIHPKSGDHPLEYVFSVGDRDYWQFANPQSLYYDRFMAIQDRFAEAEQRVTRDYLLDMHKVAVEFLNKGQLTEIAVLLHNMKQRLEYLPTVEHLYNICSVWFFDQFENPFVYDVVYAGKKIELWQQHKDVLSFFFQTDMQKYFPSWSGVEMRIQDYSTAVLSVDLAEWKYLLRRLSEIGCGQDSINSIESRIQNLTRLKESLI